MRKLFSVTVAIVLLMIITACQPRLVIYPLPDNRPSVTVPSGNPVSTESQLLAEIAEGNDVYLSSSFAISAPLSIPEGVTIDGNGNSLSIDSSVQPATNGQFITIASNNVTIKDLTIVYNGEAKGNSNHILKINGAAADVPAENIILEDLVIDGNGNAAGLNLTGTKDVTLKNVSVSDTKNVSLAISKSTGVTIIGGNYDNGDISLGGANYKFADIQINWEPDKDWQGDCGIKFEDLPEDVVVYATTDVDGKTANHTITGLGEGRYYPSESEGGMYYNAPADWKWIGLAFADESASDYFTDEFYGWGDGETSITVSDGTMTLPSSFANFWMNLKDGINTMEVGKTYRISFRVAGLSSETLTANLNLYDGKSSIDCWSISGIQNGWNTVTFTYSAHDEYDNVKLNNGEEIERTGDSKLSNADTIYGQFVFIPVNGETVTIDDFCYQEV